MKPAPDPALVIVSHYNAWPTDQLVRWLDQMVAIPAGYPWRCRIVVNQAEGRPLELPARHAGVEVFHRPNAGYNIGAWDHGWRRGPAAGLYLFVQEECRIRRPGWLRAFVDRLKDPRVGLVGESMQWEKFSWARAAHYYHDRWHPTELAPDSPVRLVDAIRTVLATRRIPPGRRAEHLQSLVLATRRDVLEAIDGFYHYDLYGDAVGAEVAISKAVEALGLRIRQVATEPFTYIEHPQWRPGTARLERRVFRRVEPYVPIAWAHRFHEFMRRRH